MSELIKTYGLGVLLSSSFFAFHHAMAALKASHPAAERRHWMHLFQILFGALMVYMIGKFAQAFWEIF